MRRAPDACAAVTDGEAKEKMMAGRSRGLGGVALCASILTLSGLASAQVPPESQLPTAEEHTTSTLPEPSPHWVYIVEPVFPHLIVSKVWIVDGDSLELLGMFNGGYTANFAIAPDAGEYYLAETFWSRGSRGERSDMVTTYDARTLEPGGEVILPEGRFLVVTKKYDAGLTTDGKHLLSFNMDPATAISVVDVEEQRYVGEVEIPGCALVFPHGPTRFSSICADGSLLTVDFADFESPQITRGEPFFDAVNDPVFEHPAFSKEQGRAFFVSYNGAVYPIDFSSGNPEVGGAWSLLSEDEKGTWWPGGWQLASYHPGSNRLFVQMHEGEQWSHKHAGEEIWVFDVETKERVHRIELEEPALSTMVTQDDQPLLFALSEAQSVSVFDATSYEHKGDVEQLGISPYLMYVTGE
jgi:methylamine dehydrogenase heavy chain